MSLSQSTMFRLFGLLVSIGAVTGGCSPGVVPPDGSATADAADGTSPGPDASCTPGTCDRVVQVAAAKAHTCARRASGSVECWGANGSGELGDGTMTMHLTPVVVTGLTDATQIIAGEGAASMLVPTTSSHTCARRMDGSAVCWGYNGSRLGDGTRFLDDTRRT